MSNQVDSDVLRKMEPQPKVATMLFSDEHCASNGGDFRSNQICEILESAELDYFRIRTGKALNASGKLKAGLARFLSTRKLPSRFPLGFSRYAINYDLVSRLQKEKRFFDTVIWEATGDPDAVVLLKRIAKTIIAVPQNIESLGAFRRGDLTHDAKAFQHELLTLAATDRVFAISEKECWLLSLFGINAVCLPYFPPTLLLDRLKLIRETRLQRSSFSGFLSIGSIGNPPTREGMITLMQSLSSVEIGDFGSIKLVGNGMESIKQFSSTNVQVLGRISNEALDEERSRAKALIIYQPATTGSLTRVVESLHAGLPVIINSLAAIDFPNLPGLYLYRGWDELRYLLTQDLGVPPPPGKPEYAVNEFIRAIHAN